MSCYNTCIQIDFIPGTSLGKKKSLPLKTMNLVSLWVNTANIVGVQESVVFLSRNWKPLA